MRKLKPQNRNNSASSRGEQAVSAILTAARDVLVEEGYPRLTMRNVAKRAGITVGNLSYYYPSKQALIQDLLQAVIQGYLEDFDRISENVERSADERFDEMVRFIMGDLATRETAGFFPALWGLAYHDEFAAKEMNKIYAIERGAFAKVIEEMRPDLSRKEIDLLALFVSSSMEGHTMFVGHGGEKASDLEEITNIAVYSFTLLVKSIDAQTIKGLKTAAGGRSPRLAS